MKKLTVALLSVAVATTAAAISEPSKGAVGEIIAMNKFNSAMQTNVVIHAVDGVTDLCKYELKNADYPYQLLSVGNTERVSVPGPFDRVMMYGYNGVSSQEEAGLVKNAVVTCITETGEEVSQSLRIPAPPKVDVSQLFVDGYSLKGSLYVEGGASDTYCVDRSNEMIYGPGNVLDDNFDQVNGFYSAYISLDEALVSTVHGVNFLKFECTGEGGKSLTVIEAYPGINGYVREVSNYWL